MPPFRHLNPYCQPPQDPSEIARLEGQHRLITHLSNNRLILPPSLHLEENSDSELTVLDATCGAAFFLLDFAKRYPSAKLYGCDRDPRLFPFQPASEGGWDCIKEWAGEVEIPQDLDSEPTEPKNATLHFRVQDIAAPEGFPTNWNEKFDLVQLRFAFVWLSMEKWSQVLKNVSRVLKPNGWIQITDASLNESSIVRGMENLNKMVRYLSWTLFESNGSLPDRISTLPPSLPGYGYNPNTIRFQAIPLQCGAIQRDGKIKKLAQEHWNALLKIVPVRKLYPRDQSDFWISGIDGEEERWPESDEEWDSRLTKARRELEIIGTQYPLWFMYARKT